MANEETSIAFMEARIARAVDAVEDQPAEVKAAVGAAAATASIPPPPQTAVGLLWTILVSGLVGVIVIALIGIIWTVVDSDVDTSPDVIVTVFSSALTGLIGLFVKSPTG